MTTGSSSDSKRRNSVLGWLPDNPIVVLALLELRELHGVRAVPLVVETIREHQFPKTSGLLKRLNENKPATHIPDFAISLRSFAKLRLASPSKESMCLTKSQ